MDYRDELRCLAHPPLLPQPLDSLPQPYTVPPIFRDKTPAPGTLSRPQENSVDCRFIPACAGNTTAVAYCCANPSVHPRVRGEHARAAASRASISGSSPRARGTLTYLNRSAINHRFIPACAGNTRPAARRLWLYNGSSPRARGTLSRHHPPQPSKRFIPACAGNTFVGATVKGGATGSSPRARGTLLPEAIDHKRGLTFQTAYRLERLFTSYSG